MSTNGKRVKDIDQLMTIEDVNYLLRISRPSLYRLTSLKLIPHYKIGRRVFFDPSEIQEWLSERKTEISVAQEDKE